MNVEIGTFTKENIVNIRKLWLVFLLICVSSLLSAQLLTESFEGDWPPAGWQVINAGAGNVWQKLVSPNSSSVGSCCMHYSYHSTQAANTWAFSSGIPMVAGRNYRVEFDQKVLSGSYPEYLKVTLGMAQTVAAQTITMLNYPSPGLTNDTYINRISPEYTCLVSGTYYLGFQCFSRRDMYQLYIDNVRFYETILNEVPSPAACVAPADNSQNIMIDATCTWAAQSGNVDGYYFSLGENNPPTSIYNGLNVGNVTSFNPASLQNSTTYYWKVTPYNEIGIAEDCPVWSFTTGPDPTITNFPYVEDFNVAIPSYGWHSLPVSGSRNWNYATITTSYPQILPQSGAGMACYNVSGAGNGASAIMVSPRITADPEQYTYQLNLWMLRNLSLPNYADKIEIYYSSSPDLNHSNSLLATVHRSMNMAPVSQEIEGWHSTELSDLPFVSGSSNYIIIRAISADGISIYVDNLEISQVEIPATPLPCVAVEPALNSANVPLDTNLSWLASDEIATGFRVYLGTDNPPTNIVNGVDVGLVYSYNPQANIPINSRYYWQVIPYNAAGISDDCPVWEFTTIPAASLNDFPYLTTFETVANPRNDISPAIPKRFSLPNYI